jgi:hypothetical protein
LHAGQKHGTDAIRKVLHIRLRHERLRLPTAVRTPRSLGFPNSYGADGGEIRSNAIPDVLSELLGRGVLQAGNVVQIAVIQGVNDRPDDLFEVPEIHHPAGMGIGRAGDAHVDAIPVAVEPAAFVALRRATETMGRLETKCFDQLEFHKSKIHKKGSKLQETRKFLPGISRGLTGFP